MPTIAEVRDKYPQYSDLSDEQLATALHKKYYSDMPYEQFAAKIGMNQQRFPDTYGGAGGFNPMLPRLAGASNAFASRLGVTPENSASPIKNAFGPLEALANAGTGLAGMIGGGYAGIGQGIKNLFGDDGMPAADRVAGVQEAVTYQPRTGTGAGFSRAAAAPAEVWSAGTNYLGEKTTDVTGSPLLGAAVKTGGDAIPMVLGARGAPEARMRGAGEQYVGRTQEPIPTTAQLREATSDAYKRAIDADVIVPAEKFAKAADEIQQAARSDAVDPVLHPKASRVLQILEDRKGKDLTLQEAENIRRIALEAEGDVNNIGQQSADGMRAGNIVDALDEKIDALSLNDEARALNRRKMNSQLIDVMIERAQNKAGGLYTQSGMENALRKEFLSLANNQQRMKRFTPPQREAIQKVARGGPMENTLRALGKFDPTSGVIPALATFATGGAMAGIGFLGRRGATRMTVKNVDAAREALIGRGLPDAQFPEQSSGMTGELVPQAPKSLPQPILVAGPRSPPMSEAARAASGFTTDVEFAGMQHPGMARTAIPERPKGLPYLPAEAKPQVIDPQGRLFQSQDARAAYLRSLGLDEVAKTIGKPGIAGDSTPRLMPDQIRLQKVGPRTTAEILKDLRQLDREMSSLPQSEAFDSPRRKALEKRAALLQAELLISGTKRASRARTDKSSGQ